MYLIMAITQAAQSDRDPSSPLHVQSRSFRSHTDLQAYCSLSPVRLRPCAAQGTEITQIQLSNNVCGIARDPLRIEMACDVEHWRVEGGRRP